MHLEDARAEFVPPTTLNEDVPGVKVEAVAASQRKASGEKSRFDHTRADDGNCGQQPGQVDGQLKSMTIEGLDIEDGYRRVRNQLEEAKADVEPLS